MSRLLKAGRRSRRAGAFLVLSTAAFATAAFFGIQYASAEVGERQSGPPALGAVPASVSATLPDRNLKSTTIVHDSGQLAVPSVTYTALHAPVTLACPATPGTCTISAEMYTEFLPDVQGDDWGTCLFVDGNFTQEPPCPWLDTNADAGEFQSRVFAGNQSNVAPGPHTVQTFIYSVGGGSAFIRNVNYRLYTR